MIFKLNSVALLHRLLYFVVVLGLAVAVPLSARHAKSFAKSTERSSHADSNAKKNQTTETDASRFTTLDGARVHYVNYGKGNDAIVLIHGWTCNLDNWHDQIPDLAAKYRVIAIDLPGHGKSDKSQIKYSMEHFARAVDAVMRDAKVKRAVLVGHSMGTPVARQFYRKYPKKTLAIVVVDGSLKPFADDAMITNLLASLRKPSYKETLSPMFAGMMGPGLSAEAKERINASFGNTPQHVIVSAMEGMVDASIWGNDKITVPVLAIMAKNPYYPPNVEQSFREIAPNMEFHMWDGVGHFLMMEKPKEFNEAVLAFLEKNKLLKK
jgi:pimeloyl-ACP methyl ester carboxylesterase